MNDQIYKYLGNRSAVEGWASVGLRCDVCMVEWTGCYDEAACPQCGNHDEWDRLMEARGHYSGVSPVTENPQEDAFYERAEASMKPHEQNDDDYQRQNESLDEAADSLATILVCLLIVAVFGIAAALLWLL